ncbi:hypothetical protein ACHQM5_001281 [Ranunculus cassubicifolius]
MNYSYMGKIPPQKLQAMVAHRNAPTMSSSSHSPWILDTGATNHVTVDSSHLSHLSEYYGPEKLHVGNGDALPIYNTGFSLLPTPSKHLLLKNVLHVPSITHNLLSVYRLVTDNNCSITFTKSNFLVKDLTTNKVLLTGLLNNGLYQTHPSSTQPLSPFAYLGVKSSTALWHSRLGHPSTYVFYKLCSKVPLLINGTSIVAIKCVSCLCAKSKRLPFNLSTHSTTAPLQLIHSDVWGPSHTTSIEGFRYYISFIDDFIRFTWIFPISHKSQFLSIFTSFKNQVENMLDCKIKTLQSDGGGEYDSHLLSL